MYSQLKEVPELVHQAKELRSLSLAYNGISELGPDVCRRLTNLTFLDLSGNLISVRPDGLGWQTYVTNCRIYRRNSGGWTTSKCSFWPTTHSAIAASRALLASKCRSFLFIYLSFFLKKKSILQLRKLDLSKTLRNHAHFPVEFQDLKDTLVDLDISMNDLGIVPAAVYALGKLQRLHLGFNKLTASGFLPSASSCWPDLETLNLTGNEFDAIPLVVCHMRKLKRLYLNENRITESGFPTKLARLSHLHTLMLSGNRLVHHFPLPKQSNYKLFFGQQETLPRFVCLMALNKFSLRKNELTSLPVEIHLLLDNARLCDITENPFLRIPPKPRENVSHEPYYGADFSLEYVMHFLFLRLLKIVFILGRPNSTRLDCSQRSRHSSRHRTTSCPPRCTRRTMATPRAGSCSRQWWTRPAPSSQAQGSPRSSKSPRRRCLSHHRPRTGRTASSVPTLTTRPCLPATLEQSPVSKCSLSQASIPSRSTRARLVSFASPTATLSSAYVPL